MAERITASEALAHFQNSLAVEPEKARDQIPVVERFTAWLGADRVMDALTLDEVSRYLREQTDGSHAQVEPLRAFLAYASRLAFTDENLVPALQLGPNAGGARGAAGANMELGGSAYHVTLEGLERLEQQLSEEKAKRGGIADELREAMADKDFRENAPLDAARDEQAHLEARIRDLEARLHDAVIIDEGAKGGRANVGSVVRLLNLAAGSEQSFTLVSPTEVDPANGKISIASPMGGAVANRAPGDEVTVNAPSGPIRFKVLDVQG